MTSLLRSLRAILFVPAALAALLLFAPRSADATVYTWRDTGTTWNTGTNWLPGLPVASSTNSLLFQGAGGGTLTNNLNALSTGVGGITFSAAAGAYTINGSSTLGLGNITNSSSSTQTFNGPISQVFAGTYSGPGNIVIAGGFSGSQNVSFTGTGDLEFKSSGKTYTGTVSASSGRVLLNASITNGDLALSSNANFESGASVVVKNFSNTGSGTMTIGSSGESTLSTTNFDLTGFTGTTFMTASGPGVSDLVSTASMNTFGGTLDISLNYLPTNFDHLLQGESWDFFSAASSAGNFSAINLTVSGSTYSLVNNGGFWSTPALGGSFGAQDGFFFSTQDTTITFSGETVTVKAGTLYAVPEPSTVVFAGIGAAMFGWSTWTRRRAKVRRRAIEAAIA